MNTEYLAAYHFLLGSKSPRRQHLLKELGLQYELVSIDLEEVYPPELRAADISRYLCELKADAFRLETYPDNTILITADTIVWLDGECIGKPANKADAVRMLSKLSGRQHKVFTGICLRSQNKKVEINKEGISVIIVEQNARQAVNIAHRTYILEDGEVALHGGKEILDSNKIKSIYFGGR